MPKIQCPNCPQRYEVDDDMIGQTLACGRCNANFVAEAVAAPKPISIACPNCQTMYEVEAKSAGMVIDCDECDMQFEVPKRRKKKKKTFSVPNRNRPAGTAAGAPAGQPPAPTEEAAPVQAAVPARGAPSNAFAAATDIGAVLDALSRGAAVRAVIGWAMRVCVIITALLGLLAWGGVSFGALKMGGTAILAALVFVLFFPIACFFCLKTVWLRSTKIMQLPDSDYTITPIISILILMYGEVFLIFAIIMSFPVGIGLWALGDLGSAPGLPSGIIGAIIAIPLCWIYGFIAYLVVRFVQEWMTAIIAIAQDVGILKQNFVSDESVGAEEEAEGEGEGEEEAEGEEEGEEATH